MKLINWYFRKLALQHKSLSLFLELRLPQMLDIGCYELPDAHFCCIFFWQLHSKVQIVFNYFLGDTLEFKSPKQSFPWLGFVVVLCIETWILIASYGGELVKKWGKLGHIYRDSASRQWFPVLCVLWDHLQVVYLLFYMRNTERL